MKPFFVRLLATCLMLWLATNLQAQSDYEQEKPSVPKWVSDKGYWVVENNKKTPKESTVFFYNNEHMLVYKEEIRDQKLKLNKKKTLLRLKSVLEEAVTSYASGNWTNQNSLLAVRLRQ
jgi:hypothetical protein